MLVIILLSFTSFSQKDTSRICLPYHTAKLIAIDLVRLDSLSNELKELNSILDIRNNEIRIKDSLINFNEKLVIEQKSEVKILTEKEKNHLDKIAKLEANTTTLENNNKNLRTATQVLGGGFIGLFTAFLTVIFLK